MIRYLKTVLSLTAFLLFSFLLTACNNEPEPWQIANITGYRPDLSFTMMSAETGEKVTADDFLGQIVVLNFGFTHCPDVCPVSLHQMNGALAKMGENADNVVVLFVTVDPKRDSLAVLKQYTDAFGPHTIGLRGDKTDIDALTTRYKVSLSYETPDERGEYDVFHGQGMTVFDKAGQARLMIRPDDSAAAIAHDLQRLMTES